MGRDFLKLTERIPDQFIKNPPQGKHGKYVGHDDIQQIALSKLGRPVSFEVVDTIRGHIPAKTTNSGKEFPERPNGVVACLARLTAVVDDATYVITEVGDANSPEIHWDGENLKTAASDAYKRCWMRLGVGLELWVEQGKNPSKYFLHAQLEKDSGGQPEVPVVPAAGLPDDQRPF